jgi:hypothetical protein
MADLQNRAAVADIESTISRLRGVASTRVAADERGEIVEVHVVADETRHPKQLSRDIESALFSELGLRIDHRKISIAQVRGMTEAAAEVRLKFLGIEYSLDRTTTRARVSVGRGEESFTGAASMPAGAKVRQEELVARATLEAVHEFLRSATLNGGSVGLELRDFTRSENSGSPFFVVSVRVMAERGEQDLIGSALVRDDPWRAAASATLDALNRRLGVLRS